MSSNKAIEVKKLVKKYANDLIALKGIDLSVEKGDFFALLGPNGAGKSTTISIINTITRKTSGQVWVNGINQDKEMAKSKLQLGIVPQEFNFNIFESCIQILINQAGFYGIKYNVAIKRAEGLLKEFGLWDKKDKPAGTLSGGLKRRLMVARSLVHNPSILILDEPTAGVDINLRRSMWELLTNLNKEGLTIVLTTHYLEEAERLCKNVAIIDQGVIIESAPIKELLSKISVENLILYCDTIAQEVKLKDLKVKKIDQNTLEIELKKGASITNLVKELNEKNISVNRIKNKENQLEELFIRLTNND